MTCKSIITTFHSFLNAAEFPKTPSPKPARIPPQTPPAGGKSAEAGRIQNPRQIVSPCRVLFNSFNHLDSARNSFELCPTNTSAKWGTPKVTRIHMKSPINPEEIEYTALFVDSPEELLQMFPAKHPKVFAHHSTNWYKPSSIEDLEVAKKSLLKIIGQAYDQKGFAVLVENAKSKNKFPHITISCAEGVAAVYSNELLEKALGNGTLEMFKEPLFVEVTEGYVDMNKNLVLSEN